MKTNHLLNYAIVIIYLTSCAEATYIQIYDVESLDNIKEAENSYVYEDENCKVSYNLWKEGGDGGFAFYNKSNKNIYINKEQCFFIVNGIAYNYYQNRVFTESKNTGASTTTYKYIPGMYLYNLIQSPISSSSGVAISNSYSVSYAEEKIVCVPSKTWKIFSEFSINPLYIRDCGLLKYPTPKKVTPKSYTESNSPLLFSNRIEYSVGESECIVHFENSFYVSRITNYPEIKVYEIQYPVICGEKSSSSKKINKYISPDRFYIIYKKMFGDESKY